jgi:hypothetical protein
MLEVQHEARPENQSQLRLLFHPADQRRSFPTQQQPGGAVVEQDMV